MLSRIARYRSTRASRLRRNAVALGSAALGATLLVGGCGGGTDAYCSDLENAKQDFAALQNGEAAKFDQAFDTLQGLGENAPDEVADDWQVISDQIDELRSALEEVGLQVSDLEGLSNGEVPEGVDQQELAELGTRLQGFGGEESQQAGEAISQHAQEECDIQLESSS